VTDSKLRELERRWKETGSVEDEARYLLERVRVGDLEREKLELAAYCGHEGAQAALGCNGHVVPSNPHDWVHGLGAWGSEASTRAAVSMVLSVLRHDGVVAPGVEAKARAAQEELRLGHLASCQTSLQQLGRIACEEAVARACDALMAISLATGCPEALSEIEVVHAVNNDPAPPEHSDAMKAALDFLGPKAVVACLDELRPPLRTWALRGGS